LIKLIIFLSKTTRKLTYVIVESIENIGYTPLHDTYKKFGRFPMIDPDWNETAFDTIDLMVALRLYNNKHLINSYVSADYKNSSNNILQVAFTF